MNTEWGKTIKYINTLPIARQLYKQKDCYYWLELATHLTNGIDVTHFTEMNNFYRIECYWVKPTKKELQKWRQDLNIDLKTFNKLLETSKMVGFEDNFIVPMPCGVWEDFEKVSRELTIGPRKTVARVFVFLYYWAMRFQGSYSKSRELIVRELRINKDNLAHALQWLEDKGFIVRSDYSKQEGYARRYYIPERYWNFQCKTEWQNMQKTLKTSK